jgi:hypothetical protein
MSSIKIFPVDILRNDYRLARGYVNEFNDLFNRAEGKAITE